MHHLLAVIGYCNTREPMFVCFFLNCLSGVIGQTKQFNSAHFTVAFILSLFVVTGVGQQRPLGMPGNREGRRVTLDLPQLLS